MAASCFARVSLLLAAACMAPGAGAQTAPAAAAASSAPSGTVPIAMTDGEVRQVDKNAARLTLRHGPLPNLDMAAMTMRFAVRDARVLDSLKEGDKVRFAAERVNGVITVTAIEPVR